MMRQRDQKTRTERVPVALPQGSAEEPAAPGGWLRSIRFSGFTVLMFVVIVLFVIIVAPGLRVYLEQRQQLAELHAAVDAKTAQNDALSQQIARWNDPAYIKAQARDRLYFVMPGETSFLVIDDVPQTGDESPTVSDQIQSTEVDWLGALFSSGLTAGLSTQTPDQLQQTGTVQ
ncbi:septum formation initiator family protein [Humibacter sp. BT305]|uniref:Septum formation initiator n=2 Tax=Cnuibacter physcomitrellae TaxID=1619308 RepID=A0A1X9LKZ1_9MICO|nr:septum formation initiator family protein [Cnuibacter physcomitrellae]ARJ05787.1 hypothetical protein B5808_11555 [Cnuibacter physcomitrellae]AXH35593.1 septum formation initiator family protein [Humibacter sp. BT305]MCS5496487.1 septum formation initiator family protein [Cnuibacter physcomitrellae]